MKTHKEGKGSKYIKSKGFKKLVYYEKYNNKITAMKREYALKKSPRLYKLNLVNNFKRNIN